MSKRNNSSDLALTHLRCGQNSDNRGDEFRSKVFKNIGRHDGGGHGRGSDLKIATEKGGSRCDPLRDLFLKTYRCDDVGLDVVLYSLLGQSHGE